LGKFVAMSEEKLQGKLVIAFGKVMLLLQFDSGYRFFARGSHADLRDDGVDCDAGCVECDDAGCVECDDADVAAGIAVVDVDDVDAVCVGNGTVSIDACAVAVGGAGDDGIIDARRRLTRSAAAASTTSRAWCVSSARDCVDSDSDDASVVDVVSFTATTPATNCCSIAGLNVRLRPIDFGAVYGVSSLHFA